VQGSNIAFPIFQVYQVQVLEVYMQHTLFAKKVHSTYKYRICTNVSDRQNQNDPTTPTNSQNSTFTHWPPFCTLKCCTKTPVCKRKTPTLPQSQCVKNLHTGFYTLPRAANSPILVRVCESPSFTFLGPSAIGQHSASVTHHTSLYVFTRVIRRHFRH
jgi:hypothetical protein